MSTARRYHHSYADYLALEKQSPFKLEFSDGEIFAMAGGTPEHGALAMRFAILCAPLLAPDCTVFSSDVKVRIHATDLGTYPDVSIVCGSVERAKDDENAVTNPRYVVEVTSTSTEDYDRGDKLSQYKQLPSLEVVYLVSHRRKEVTIVARDGRSWTETVVRSGERVTLAGGSFEVDELYTVLGAVG